MHGSWKVPAYFPVFVAGERVRIKSASKLREFMLPNWPWHHPLTEDQLGFAGIEANVTRVEYYHGGDVILRLVGVPGPWHEECVEDWHLSQANWDAYPSPGEFFRIEKLTHDGRDYVRIVTRDNLECLRKYVAMPADQEVENIRKVAALRHFVGFEQRFDFHSGFEPDPAQWQLAQEKAFRERFVIPADSVLPNEQITPEVLAALHRGIPGYPIRNCHPRYYFQAAEWSRWEREVSRPDDLEEDEQIRTLCNFYVAANPTQRQALREMASGEWSLLHFAHRSAVRALRTAGASDVLTGLVALSINDLADTLSGGFGSGRKAKESATRCMVEILSRVATIIDANLPSMIEQVADISSPYTAEALRNAAAAPLGGHGIREYDDENGKMIGWPAWPRSNG
jgi:hypothetical protein